MVDGFALSLVMLTWDTFAPCLVVLAVGSTVADIARQPLLVVTSHVCLGSILM